MNRPLQILQTAGLVLLSLGLSRAQNIITFDAPRAGTGAGQRRASGRGRQGDWKRKGSCGGEAALGWGRAGGGSGDVAGGGAAAAAGTACAATPSDAQTTETNIARKSVCIRTSPG